MAYDSSSIAIEPLESRRLLASAVGTAVLGNVQEINLNGAQTLQFTLDFTAANGVTLSTIRTGAVSVVGPGARHRFTTVPKLAGVSGRVSPILATFNFTAPGGAFTTANNGVYTVYLARRAVRDLNGDVIASGAVGTFTLGANGNVAGRNLTLLPIVPLVTAPISANPVNPAPAPALPPVFSPTPIQGPFGGGQSSLFG